MRSDGNTEDKLRRKYARRGLSGEALNRAVASRRGCLGAFTLIMLLVAFVLFGEGLKYGDVTPQSWVAVLPVFAILAARWLLLVGTGEEGKTENVLELPSEGNELALGFAPGEENGNPIEQLKGIAQEDRQTHMYVVGGSGTGKTKFLESLIRQDVERGEGFAVIDPHGDLFETAKGLLALKNEQDETFLHERVIVLDPMDTAHTVAFNPLERIATISSAEQAAELVGVFKKIWAESWGARMEDLLRNTLIALSENELTLIELPSFLSDERFRGACMRRVEHSVCRQYFTRFDALPKRTRDEWAESTLNKANAFLSDERIRIIFASTKSSFSFRDVMDSGKVLLANLDRGRLKGGGDLLGALLIAKMQMAAFSRTDTPQSKRRQFYLYIDEFQNFATDSFVETLAEARKYHLALIMAHQNLAQLTYSLRASIMANCGVQVLFRLSREDAQLLAKDALTALFDLGWEDTIQALQTLPPRTCFAHNKRHGGVVLLMTLDAQPPYSIAGMEEEAFRRELDARSVGEAYLRPREDIEREAGERQRALLSREDDPESNRQ